MGENEFCYCWLGIVWCIIMTVILAYSRTKHFFYAYYVLKTLIAMASEGSVQFLALAYVVKLPFALSRSLYFCTQLCSLRIQQDKIL